MPAEPSSPRLSLIRFVSIYGLLDNNMVRMAISAFVYLRHLESATYFCVEAGV